MWKSCRVIQKWPLEVLAPVFYERLFNSTVSSFVRRAYKGNFYAKRWRPCLTVLLPICSWQTRSNSVLQSEHRIVTGTWSGTWSGSTLTFAGWEQETWSAEDVFFLFYSGVYRVGAWVPAVAWTCGTCPWQYLVFAPFLRFASFKCLSSPRTLKRQPYLPPFTLSVEWWSFWECITFMCGLPDEAHSGKSGKSLIEFGQ